MAEPKILAGPGVRPGGVKPPAHPRPPHWIGVLIARVLTGDPDLSLTKNEHLAYQNGRARGFRWGAAYGLAIGICLAMTVGFGFVASQGLAVQWAYERGRETVDPASAGPAVLDAATYGDPAPAPPKDPGYARNPVNHRALPVPADAPQEERRR